MKLLLPVLMLAAVLSCARPDSYESFIRSDEAVGGVYRFPLDLSDTLSYDLYLFSVTDYHDWSGRSASIEVRWTSPSGENASEMVILPLGGHEGRKELYRSSVMPQEHGEWTVSVHPCESIGKLRGIGLICKENGTRQTPEIR